MNEWVGKVDGWGANEAIAVIQMRKDVGMVIY